MRHTTRFVSITLALSASVSIGCDTNRPLVKPNRAPTTNADTTPDPTPRRWRYILVEDTTSPVAGDFPGLDVDAIEVVDQHGQSHFATTVVDHHLGDGSARDPLAVLGSPDAYCGSEPTTFASLGGQEANGYIVVGFDTDDAQIDFGAGSTVIVHDMNRLCGNWWDDVYAVSVSTHGFGFLQVGTGGGWLSIPVTTDP